jgi:RNA polymerase sigma-70 factor, ECF subfamily
MLDQHCENMHRDIILQLPHLRAFAVLLTHDRSFADDLVQEAVVRALAHADQFRPETKFKAWITTILRNSYFNVIRRSSRVSPLSLISPDDEPVTSGGQEERMGALDFERAFKCLPTAQREALLLVGASRFSYEDAARVAGCAVGTMKSRVARGRVQLAKMLDGEDADGLAPAPPKAARQYPERVSAARERRAPRAMQAMAIGPA